MSFPDPEAGPSGSNQESKEQFEASTSTAGTSSASGSKTADQSKAEGNSWMKSVKTFYLLTHFIKQECGAESVSDLLNYF